jgi:hypothetical protein
MILSIDIGVRNLSMCIMSCTNKTDLGTYKIHLWEDYNTLEADTHICTGIQKSGKLCGKKGSYKRQVDLDTSNEDVVRQGTVYSCKTHFPKDTPIKKEHIFKPKLIKDYLLQDLVTIILKKMQEIYTTNKELFNSLSSIIIELQPTLNPRMKLVSHVLYGKLVEIYMDRNNQPTIRFIRASNKLKAYTGPEIKCALKGKYAQRKWLSVQYTRYFLENKFSKEQKEIWLNNFLTCGKADDRSDTALMAINGLYGIPKKQIRNKNGSEIK